MSGNDGLAAARLLAASQVSQPVSGAVTLLSVRFCISVLPLFCLAGDLREESSRARASVCRRLRVERSDSRRAGPVRRLCDERCAERKDPAELASSDQPVCWYVLIDSCCLCCCPLAVPHAVTATKAQVCHVLLLHCSQVPTRSTRGCRPARHSLPHRLRRHIHAQACFSSG